MTRRLCYAAIVLAAASLVVGYLLSPWRIWALAVGGLGLLWIFLEWHGWGWFAHLGLAGFVGGAAAGAWLGLPTGWMVAGSALALGAWDLSCFSRRLEMVRWSAPGEEGASLLEEAAGSHIERRHLLRLLLVVGLGGVLGALALLVRVRFGITVGLLLGLLMIFGLSQVVTRLRREGL